MMKKTNPKDTSASYKSPSRASQALGKTVGGTQQRFMATVSDPTLKRSFQGHRDTVSGVAFNPNLKQAISSSLDGSLMVWNFKPQLRPFRFVGHKGPIHDIDMHPTGNLMATASGDSTIRLWTNSVEGKSTVIKSHFAPVKSVSFSSDGELLLSSSDDKTLKCWTVNDKKF
jgi:centriolar protein POC1